MVERLVANEKVEGSNPFARSSKVYLLIMSELYKKKCADCNPNTPAFDISEIHKYLKKINGWNVESNEEKKFFL